MNYAEAEEKMKQGYAIKLPNWINMIMRGKLVKDKSSGMIELYTWLCKENESQPIRLTNYHKSLKDFKIDTPKLSAYELSFSKSKDWIVVKNETI